MLMKRRGGKEARSTLVLKISNLDKSRFAKLDRYEIVSLLRNRAAGPNCRGIAQFDSMTQKLSTVPKAAARIGVSVSVLRSAIQRGQIPAVQIGSRYYVSSAVLDQHVARACATTANPRQAADLF